MVDTALVESGNFREKPEVCESEQNMMWMINLLILVIPPSATGRSVQGGPYH